jgi:hypothetical protein
MHNIFLLFTKYKNIFYSFPHKTPFCAFLSHPAGKHPRAHALPWFFPAILAHAFQKKIHRIVCGWR